jgi:hypothetical protein
MMTNHLKSQHPKRRGYKIDVNNGQHPIKFKCNASVIVTDILGINKSFLTTKALLKFYKSTTAPTHVMWIRMLQFGKKAARKKDVSSEDSDRISTT